MVSLAYLLEKRRPSGISRTGRPGYPRSPFGLGGGSPRIVQQGVPFAGRQFGGLPRSQIYAGRGYGGGYGSYARAGALGGVAGFGFGYVGGLGFPFGYWPLYYHPNYYRDDEYGPHNNESRPGGPLMSASFNRPGLSPSDAPQYMVYGDRDSIGNVTGAVVEDCSAVPVVEPTAVNDDGTYPDGVNTTLLPALNPQNVAGFYRSSSFALYAFFDDVPTDLDATVNYTEPIDTPPYKWPSAVRDIDFEECVNNTIQASLPIEEGINAAFRGVQPDSRSALAAAALGVLVVNGVKWPLALSLACLLFVAGQQV
ncbi:hypothetical protein Rhopal_005819-T1 [Rhodotorula paludigena]|uniref:Uncharacterized protein n=1 Tax=Rhodotorula paludigena TaxID=86838 RepID=A0AAV5GKA5_9BASI|nr:hypothetical protein Rhopal_005819-T1 [Rhodotorula paludigena]